MGSVGGGEDRFFAAVDEVLGRARRLLENAAEVSESDDSAYKRPPAAHNLKYVLKDEGVDSWDWIVQQLSGDPPNPLEKKRIEEGCTPFEIAKTYAMHVYSNSGELKDG
ncbi:hypothetical protein FGG69_gp29 [Salinibacter phage SRUTV-1]|uniref:Uncharacterized protein n=1 Tax=Salinibacter phage SRUTV-1 TaxID=2684227 RepID=A0A2D3FAK3_9CAUD|nr:hypothetical protein FGG69_gp29 [Salinibacter phage SRUTV-1]ATU47039.1 hypothetical protein [Salinibacter phage SRUTV-1]